MNQFLIVLVEPELAGQDEAIIARVAELMAPYSQELLWIPHQANCLDPDCVDEDIATPASSVSGTGS